MDEQGHCRICHCLPPLLGGEGVKPYDAHQYSLDSERVTGDDLKPFRGEWKKHKRHLPGPVLHLRFCALRCRVDCFCGSKFMYAKRALRDGFIHQKLILRKSIGQL